ncbi:hypothetical protein KAH81_05790 [bacterium]|nr:hypothetical protein [bacterium]
MNRFFYIAILSACLGIGIISLSCSIPEPSGDILFLQDSIFYSTPARGGIPKAISIDTISFTTSDTINLGEWTCFIHSNSLIWIPREGSEPIVISAEDEFVTGFDISPKNGQVCYTLKLQNSQDYALIVKAIPEGKIIRFFITDNECSHPSLDLTGLWVAFEIADSIYLGYLPDGSIQPLVKGSLPKWLK